MVWVTHAEGLPERDTGWKATPTDGFDVSMMPLYFKGGVTVGIAQKQASKTWVTKQTSS